jgi:hypothetical protein
MKWPKSTSAGLIQPLFQTKLKNLMNIPKLECLKAGGPVDKYRAIAHQGEFRGASQRAAGALRSLLSFLNAADLLAHAATTKDPLATLQSIEVSAKRGLEVLKQGREANAATLKRDAEQRFRFDSAAMSLFHLATEEVRNQASRAACEDQEAESVRALLDRLGLAPQDAIADITNRALGINERQDREARDAIADAIDRIAGIDAMLTERDRGSAEITDAAITDMRSLRDRLVTEVEANRDRLRRNEEEAKKLEALAASLGKKAGSLQLGALQVELIRAQRSAEEARQRGEAARETATWMERFLVDPERRLEDLPERPRAELVARAAAPVGQMKAEQPRFLQATSRWR